MQASVITLIFQEQLKEMQQDRNHTTSSRMENATELVSYTQNLKLSDLQNVKRFCSIHIQKKNHQM
jgi:hypothetical protein